MAAVIAHFQVVKGRAYSIRFKDWNHFDAADQGMVQITPNVWQIVKRYNRSGYKHVCTITKPVAGSVSVRIAGSPITPAAIDTLTGPFTFASAPGSTPTASFQSDGLVRFAALRSWAWPAVSSSLTGRPFSSTAALIFVLSPPRERPMA